MFIKRSIKAHERKWIEILNCVNKRIEGRTKKEWYCDNLEKNRDKNRVYRENNIDKIKEYDKNRYNKNSPRCLKMKEKYNCTCGASVQKGGKIKHEKTNKHQKYLQKMND